MSRPNSDGYQMRLNQLDNEVENGPVSESEADAIRRLCNAFDEHKPSTPLPVWPDAQSNICSYKTYRTLDQWTYSLIRYARHIDLLDTSETEINHVAELWISGDSPHVDDPLSKGSVRVYQNSIRMFYRYHDDCNIDPQSIQTFSKTETGIDVTDMLSKDEFVAVRDAPTHPRDKCIVDLLLYTGVRNTGLRTLRIKDVDVAEGTYRFNTDRDGLKGIFKPRVERPLLNARKAVRDWKEYHPASDDPDAYLITAKPNYNQVDPFSPTSPHTIQQVMRSVKEEAGIDKPLHPHAARHNMVSICKRDYDLDDDTVRFLIGHAPNSRVMETTYSHLSGEDYRQKAEIAAGIRDEREREQTFSPMGECDFCGDVIPEDANVCPYCETELSPATKRNKERVDRGLAKDEGAAEATGDDRGATVAEQIGDLLDNNPDAKARLAEELADELSDD